MDASFHASNFIPKPDCSVGVVSGTSGVLWSIVFALVSSESNCAHTPVVITKDGKQGLRGELFQN